MCLHPKGVQIDEEMDREIIFEIIFISKYTVQSPQFELKTIG